MKKTYAKIYPTTICVVYVSIPVSVCLFLSILPIGQSMYMYLYSFVCFRLFPSFSAGLSLYLPSPSLPPSLLQTKQFLTECNLQHQLSSLQCEAPAMPVQDTPDLHVSEMNTNRLTIDIKVGMLVCYTFKHILHYTLFFFYRPFALPGLYAA